MGKYNYSRPVTNKLPSPISQLGLIVKALEYDKYLTSKEVFKRAFQPHQSIRACNSLLYIATLRDYAIIEDRLRRPAKFILTNRGQSVKEALTCER